MVPFFTGGWYQFRPRLKKIAENKMAKKWGDCLLFYLDATYQEDSLIFYSNSLISDLKQVNGNNENKGLGTIEKYILSVLNGVVN